MTTIVGAALVNRPFGDPVVLVDFRFESRALLLDFGDIAALLPRKIFRVSDVFVSPAAHTGNPPADRDIVRSSPPKSPDHQIDHQLTR